MPESENKDRRGRPLKTLTLKKEAVPTLFLGSGTTAEPDLSASSTSSVQDQSQSLNDPVISMEIQDGSGVELQEHFRHSLG